MSQEALEHSLQTEAVDSILNINQNGVKDEVFGTDIEDLSQFKIRKQEIKAQHELYISNHPEIREFTADYLQMLLHAKPQDVFAFTKAYFNP